ncbi:MAG: phospholipase D-like domain-containing protein [Candidatus Eremiobacterota bacterium]
MQSILPSSYSYAQPQAALFARGRTTSKFEPPPSDSPDDELYEDDTAFPEPEPGRVRIGRDIITEEGLDALAQIARKIKLDGSLSPKRLDRIFKDIRETQTVAKEDLEDIKRFVRDLESWHRELHTAYRDSKYSDQKLNQDIMTAHLFLQQWVGARERYRTQARTQELDRISEGSSAFSPTTAGFYTWAAISQKAMKETLSVMEGLKNGDGAILFKGNSAEMLTRDQIWQTKMTMLNQAVEQAKAGKPPEIDVQYYELTSRTMLSKLVECSRAGCKVRVNLDPGRVTGDRQGVLYVTELSRKLYTAVCLLDAADAGADIGLSLFPVHKEIGDENLMHQKLFRVGDQVILGGMNANSASSENVDAAVKLQGPGARRLVEIFQEDTERSVGAELADIYDPEKTSLISAGHMYVGPSGLISLLLMAAGTDFRGVDRPLLPWNGETLNKLAEAAGTRVDLLVEFDDMNEDGVKDGFDLQEFMARGDQPSNVVELKRDGGRLLSRQLKEIVERLNDDANHARAMDVELPDGKPVGAAALAVGNEPTERMAILLHAIATAEKHIYVPSFVMTRVVARAIAARYEELKAQGKTLDVKVVLDSGIYPDGGTPNEAGYLALEDAGIPVRWALLERTDPAHDRKIHAKALITEKMAVLGSTNMSSRGLMDNWELSGAVTFDESDPELEKQRRELIADFMRTWERDSVEINTRKVAEERLKEIDTPDKPHRIQEARSSITREVIRRIYNYERDSAALVRRLVESNPEVREAIDRKVAQGVPEGYATLTALDEVLGPFRFDEELRKMESWKALEPLTRGNYLEFDSFQL